MKITKTTYNFYDNLDTIFSPVIWGGYKHEPIKPIIIDNDKTCLDLMIVVGIIHNSFGLLNVLNRKDSDFTGYKDSFNREIERLFNTDYIARRIIRYLLSKYASSPSNGKALTDSFIIALSKHIGNLEEPNKYINEEIEIIKLSFISLTKGHIDSLELISPENKIFNSPTVLTEEEQFTLPEVELKTINDRIRLLSDLGIIEHLKNKYPNSFRDVNPLADIISKILVENKTSVQPSLNSLLNDNSSNKNYPKENSRTKAIIDTLNANELI
ncbi:hypothetical protein DNU06_02590 [Putridiphycobacter roseus]|uniref:Uncharacterized protein n=1 Tax=Putridiphycobacter roseus TaxID=2219161 RepID=A0A2W1NGV0_9FLAO|nr:hypothetical protein [Putridiphycobacter roseus]PZE18735.1 hypothetical protein DNU06_02590 [Putridiphycobacter roseus]